MKVKYVGHIHGHSDPSSEGLRWILLEDLSQSGKNKSPTRIVEIEADDRLIIYDENRSVIFNDIIQPNYLAGLFPVFGFRINWVQQNFDPDRWILLFIGWWFKESGPSAMPLHAELIRNETNTEREVCP